MLGHVVTGSLDILVDEVIKTIFKFGSKFRLIPEFNAEIVKNDIKTGVNDYIHKMAFKLKLPLEYFSEWKIKLLKLIFDKIDSTNNTFPCTVNKYRFSRVIKEIQSKYIIVPVDKVDSNFSFI